MKQDLHTRLKIEIKEQVRDKTPVGIVDILVQQEARRQEAGERIDKEGSVVRDLKGAVVAHPALKIEIEAGKIIADLLAKYRK
jgi:hypothetical protein